MPVSGSDQNKNEVRREQGPDGKPEPVSPPMKPKRVPDRHNRNGGKDAHINTALRDPQNSRRDIPNPEQAEQHNSGGVLPRSDLRISNRQEEKGTRDDKGTAID